jgi:tungstate transport system ATP-binding protein
VSNAHWIELQRLGLTEGRVHIVVDVSLKVSVGRTVIIGPNGAGKSTLLRLMHGLLKPSVGHIAWPRPLTQGMVFQRPVILRTTALANIEYGLAVRGLARTVRRERALSALLRVGLLDLAGRQAKRLSGGEQQRIALACAWALEPQVLFLDEPTASLDPASSREIERIVGEIAENGAKIVMTTHNLGQAHRIADEVIYLENGRVLEQTQVTEFFHQPRTEAAQEFIREEFGTLPA